MAKAVVSFATERLEDLLVQEAKFLHRVEDQVMDLWTELIRMQCFLEDADAVKDKDERVRNRVEIRELAYRAENVLATYIFEVESRRRRRGFCGSVKRLACIFKEGIALHKVRSEIDSIKNKITGLSRSLQTYGIRELSSGEGSSSVYGKLQMLRPTYSHVIEEDGVDFHRDTWKLVEDLVDEERQFQAISICGIGGLGKTTLAKQVYHHPRVRRDFDGFVWACISQQPKKGDILRGILASLMPEKKREEIVSMRDEELVKQVFETLQEKKCLVVLDDIWSKDDWDAIKAAFPTGRKGGSKILLTSRNKDVATYVDSSRVPHEPQLLNDDESWELFEKKIFTRGDHTESTITEDQQWELGRKMLKHCRGLPLAIEVLGGVLARKHTLDEWKTVDENINFYLMEDKVKVIETLALSYYDLPSWLKPCFLYLGNYPKDYEILAHTLYQLWIAEGFISLNEGRRRKEETLMDVAERYLGELAQRSMVQVQIVKVEDEDFEDRSFGRFKSCRLHDLIREMCLSMVKEENFLKVIDHGQSSERQSRPLFSSSSTLGSKIHRLAIHGNENIDPSNLCIDQEKNILGVLFFDGNKCTRSRKEFVSHLPKNFKLARVMHLEELGSNEGVESVELPKAVGDLIHLRYLRLGVGRGMFKLPSSIGNLRYLQTLDLSLLKNVIIPNVLWKLKQLMHLYFPPAWWNPAKNEKKLQLDGLDNLEVLEKFNSRYFIIEDLQKLINLRSLTEVFIQNNRQDLEAFVNYLMSITRKQLLLRYSSLTVDQIDFCAEDELALLKQIFFECHSLHNLCISGRIRELPEYPESFHSSLTHLSLARAELEEDPMAILEKLPNLAVLHLMYNAYIGEQMVCSDQGFPRLKKLMLEGLEHLEDWKVDEESMPNLSYLTIACCSKLKMVPNGLGYITTLQELYISRMPQAFVRRLKSPDGVDFKKVFHIPSIRVEDTLPDRESNEEDQVTIVSSVEEL